MLYGQRRIQDSSPRRLRALLRIGTGRDRLQQVHPPIPDIGFHRALSEYQREGRYR